MSNFFCNDKQIIYNIFKFYSYFCVIECLVKYAFGINRNFIPGLFGLTN